MRLSKKGCWLCSHSFNCVGKLHENSDTSYFPIFTTITLIFQNSYNDYIL